MTTAWTLPAQDIITDALQLIGQIGAGQTASADDYSVCMTALQNIIKELPLHGLSWPKITVAPVPLAWSDLTPALVALPVDYFGVPVVSYVQNGTNVDLRIIAKAEYDALPRPATTTQFPQQLYIAPNNVGYLYPVPIVNPNLVITYQAVTLDATLNTMPDVAQSWIGGMGLWLAHEVGPKFGVDMQTRMDIQNRHLSRRTMMLSYATETAPIVFTVDN